MNPRWDTLIRGATIFDGHGGPPTRGDIAIRDGKIAERGELPVRFGRVSKATPESRDFSIDVVLMTGPGPRHRHPAGEINYCIRIDGEPTFMDQPPGWVDEAPDSVHVPSVAGGTMLIVYLLPQGQMEFLS